MQQFVNADLVAAGLAVQPGSAALRAGRLMIQLIAEHVERGDSFAFETTLADKGYARATFRTGQFVSIPGAAA